MIPIAGQNNGAEKYDRIDKGLKIVNILGWGLTLALSVIAYFFGPLMMGLFIDTAESDVIAYGHQFLLYYVMGYGYIGVCLALPMAWVFTAVYLIPVYLMCRKRMLKDKSKFSSETAIIK